MTYDFIPALAAFALVSSITPGPNNIMLMTSGANFGFRRTLPHMLGVGIGFVLMIVLVGIGLAGLFEAFPFLTRVMLVLSLAYTAWLAWKIANAGAPVGRADAGVPITFVQAALFQWVNPKAWAMALTAVTLYAPNRGLAAIALVAAIFGLINLPAVSSWTILGQQLRRILTHPGRLRAFNITMAVMLLGSLYPVLMR